MQTLGSAFLNIMWPYELANGKWLLYPASLSFENHTESRCTSTEALNPLKLPYGRSSGAALQSQHTRAGRKARSHPEDQGHDGQVMTKG
ncbi:hypothetical protein CRUP_015476, partial [Coryphaenoides rupestris]